MYVVICGDERVGRVGRGGKEREGGGGEREREREREKRGNIFLGNEQSTVSTVFHVFFLTILGTQKQKKYTTTTKNSPRVEKQN